MKGAVELTLVPRQGEREVCAANQALPCCSLSCQNADCSMRRGQRRILCLAVHTMGVTVNTDWRGGKETQLQGKGSAVLGFVGDERGLW